MKILASDPESYLAAVPKERRSHLETLRTLVKQSVPTATEGIFWGMLCYTIGERPFAALASQKNYLSLYLMDLYSQPGLRDQHAAALAHLKMGKSCINFHSTDELPLDTIAAILREAPNVVVKGGTMETVAHAKPTAGHKKSAKKAASRTIKKRPPKNRN
jgi:uncharacterized protein YdhG (YjbR/CyaY superfamily)